jgi:hypothetical protein
MDTELNLRAISAARDAEARRLVRTRAARELTPIARPRGGLAAAVRSAFGWRTAPAVTQPEATSRPRITPAG